MKRILKYTLCFSVVFCLNSIAQQPGDSRPDADDTSLKGRRTLRKEKRALRWSSHMAFKNERRSRFKNNTGTVNLHKMKRKKLADKIRKTKTQERRHREKQQAVNMNEKNKG